MSKLTSSAAFVVLLLACGSEKSVPPPPPPPPPAPVLPVEPVPEPSVEAPVNADDVLAQAMGPVGGEQSGTLRHKPEGIAVGEPNPAAPEEKPAKKGTSLYDLVEQGKAKMPVNPKKPVVTKPEPAKPVVTKPEITKPEPVVTKPVTPQPTKPAGKVTVPRTKNVHVEFPKGLQADLDADPRMQPFVNQVIGIADKCYADERARNPLAAGVIELTATMHSEARPDVDVKKSPTVLAGVVACGMGRLMSVKMPLFTGKEGQKYPLKIVFTK